MSDIGTHRQVVDSERFSTGYDATYQRKPSKPGKTVYVCRDGKMVPKEDVTGFVMCEASVMVADEINANMRRWESALVASMGVPAKELEGRHPNCSIGTAG